jgi:hypothetical protein
VRLGKQRVHVIVDNPHRRSRGVTAITLDGAPLASNQISLDPEVAGTHEIRVELGSAALASVG